MKKVSGSKSNSAAAIITLTAAVTLIGLTSAALRRGRLDTFIQGVKRRKGMLSEYGNPQDITAENTLLRENLERLSTMMDKMVLQNEKLLSKNMVLERALEEEHERVAKLMDVITAENEEKLFLTRKLEDANTQLSKTGCITDQPETLKEAKTKVS